MKFAENLNEYLDSHDISNYRIYKDTGLSDSLIGYWRKGQKQPTLENLVILCDYLNVSIDYLVGNISARRKTAPLLPLPVPGKEGRSRYLYE